MATAVTSLHQRAIMETVDRAAQKYPADAARIARAGQILIAGGVRQVTPTLWLVRSQSDAAVTYAVTAGACVCEDYAQRRRLSYRCKHAIAVWLYGIAQERERVLLERETPDPTLWAPEQAKRLQFARWLVQSGRMAA